MQIYEGKEKKEEEAQYLFLIKRIKKKILILKLKITYESVTCMTFSLINLLSLPCFTIN